METFPNSTVEAVEILQNQNHKKKLSTEQSFTKHPTNSSLRGNSPLRGFKAGIPSSRSWGDFSWLFTFSCSLSTSTDMQQGARRGRRLRRCCWCCFLLASQRSNTALALNSKEKQPAGPDTDEEPAVWMQRPRTGKVHATLAMATLCPSLLLLLHKLPKQRQQSGC